MNNPRESDVVKAKIENGDVKVKAAAANDAKTTKVAVSKKAARKSNGLSEEKLLAWMKEQGDKEINSTAIRDAFKLKNRAPARHMMKPLAKLGKVVVAQVTNGKKRKHFTYKIAA